MPPKKRTPKSGANIGAITGILLRIEIENYPIIGEFQVYPSTYFTKYNEMDRRWKKLIFMTRLFNARKLVECPLYVELIFQVEAANPLIC
jgi:hypothetical protein